MFCQKAVVHSEYCEIFENGCFWKRVHETEKKRLFIRHYCIYILYIKETSVNVCFFHERSKKMIFLFQDCFPLEFVFRYNISVMWWEINSKQEISTWVNQEKIEIWRKEYVINSLFEISFVLHVVVPFPQNHYYYNHYWYHYYLNLFIY